MIHKSSKANRQKNKEKFDPFKNQVLDEYEQELENALEKGQWKSVGNFQKRKEEVEQVARYTLNLRRSKPITFRIPQGDLIRLKERAEKRSIPYQTLLVALIRDYVEGKYSIRL